MNNKNQIKMTIKENTSIFYINQNEYFEIPVGFEQISNKYLKSTPPTHDEIEYAINYIKDEIEKLVKKLPSNYSIISNDNFILEFAKMCDIKIDGKALFEKEKLEYLFGQYAEVSMGKYPQSFQSDLSPIFYSKLLILREYMHHLKFDNFYVVQEG